MSPVSSIDNTQDGSTKHQRKSITLTGATMDRSSPSGSRSTFTSRRSVAHNPRLLGFDDVDLMELQSRPKSPNSARQTTLKPPPQHSFKSRQHTNVDAPVDDRFRVEEEEGTASVDGVEEVVKSGKSSPNGIVRPLSEQSENLRSAAVRQDSYRSAEMYGDDKEDDDDLNLKSIHHRQNENGYAEINGGDVSYEGEESFFGDVESALTFEATTPREKTWMWTSVVLVAILTIVSISIAVGWIDWPGDGLGQN